MIGLKCRQTLAKMLIIDELYHSSLLKMKDFTTLICNMMQPNFSVPSQPNFARDCIRLYLFGLGKVEEIF